MVILSPQMSARVALLVALSTALLQAQPGPISVVLALPSATLISATAYVAQDRGLFRAHGLNVAIRNVVGVGSPNAVLAGSADFTIGTGSTFLRAVSRGQRFFAIGNMVDRPLVELVLRSDVAMRVGIREGLSLPERARRLKGLTIGIQGVGSIVHAWQRYVAARGGLDVERDVRIVPMDPAAMIVALQSRLIDGYASSPPYSTHAVLMGQATILASSATDAPELLPFAYGLLYTTADKCTRQREMCARMARAFMAASRQIHDKPTEVFETVLRKRFATMQPALLSAAWSTARQAHARDLRITTAQLDNAQKVSIEAGLLSPTDAVKRYDGLYTNEFIQ